LVITSRRVIARASRHNRRSVFPIERHYPTRRTSLNDYAPEISNVYDTVVQRIFLNWVSAAMLRPAWLGEEWI
jgi:hypothetical protein